MRAQAPGLFAALVLQMTLKRTPPLVRAAALRTLVAHGRRVIDRRTGYGEHEFCRKM